MDLSKLSGTGVALATPFNENYEVDYQSLEKLVDHVTKGGVDYLVVMGTTGEASTLSAKEKNEVLNFIKSKNDGKLPIVYGIGGNSTFEVVEKLKEQDYTGIDAILSVAPYYNKPSQAGYIHHYTEVANNSKLPVIMYNVPGRTASNMNASSSIELAKHPNIIAVKEASGDLVQCAKIAANTPDDFLLISGDDMLSVPMISIGASGVISVIANFLPDQFSKAIKNALSGEFDGAAKGHYGLLEISDYLFQEGNPAGLKCALAQIEIMKETLRPPLMPVTDSLRKNITKWVKSQFTLA